MLKQKKNPQKKFKIDLCDCLCCDSPVVDLLGCVGATVVEDGVFDGTALDGTTGEYYW